MKLKQRQTDFRVEELLRGDFLRPRGAHRVYRVTKRKHTSVEAARVLSDLAGVAAREVSMAGLKDRQGVTRQYMTIPGGREVSYRDLRLGIETVGFSERRLESRDSQGNAFAVIARDLSRVEVERLRASLEAVREHGLPNYFDEQRFGNLRHNQGWIVRHLLHGRIERGLRRMLSAVSDHDRAETRAFKSALHRCWGDWSACRDVAGRFGKHHSVFEHLRRAPHDFAGAFRHVATRERLIHLYAWQSHLWNRALAMHLGRSLPGGERFALRGREGRLVFPRGACPAPDPWGGTFPLTGARLQGVTHADQRSLYTEVLAAMGLRPAQLAVEGVPGFALKPEERGLVVRPSELRARPTEPDRENRDRRLVRLSFRLPRGAYATLVVRRLVGPPRAS